jgi:HEAT repeat protein
MSPPRVRAAVLVAVLGFAAPAIPRAAAGTEGATGRAASFEDLVGRLGSPADPAVVSRILAHARRSDPVRTQAVVGALWHAGGHAAARGLLEIGARSEGAQRALAWECFARLGIRVASAPHLRAVREALDDPDMSVRRQAFAAIGILGTAEDLPALLAAAGSPDGAVRTCAWGALPRLTGVRMQPQARRWTEWWAESEKDLRAAVSTALDDLELGEDSSRVQHARVVLARHAWADLAVVEEAVRGWIAFGDIRLRVEGYRVVAALRWGELADDLARALRYERDDDALEEGRRAGRVVGLPVPPAPPTANVAIDSVRSPDGLPPEGEAAAEEDGEGTEDASGGR